LLICGGYQQRELLLQSARLFAKICDEQQPVRLIIYRGNVMSAHEAPKENMFMLTLVWALSAFTLLSTVGYMIKSLINVATS